MKDGKALVNEVIYASDFGLEDGNNGLTGSHSGKALFVNCLKCVKCGHSYVVSNS